MCEHMVRFPTWLEYLRFTKSYVFSSGFQSVNTGKMRQVGSKETLFALTTDQKGNVHNSRNAHQLCQYFVYLTKRRQHDTSVPQS